MINYVEVIKDFISAAPNDEIYWLGLELGDLMHILFV